MKDKKIVLFKERLSENSDREIFVGYIEGNGIWKKDSDKSLSRTHHQFNRIYSAFGIHPTLASSETSGRYYVYEGICDSSK